MKCAYCDTKKNKNNKEVRCEKCYNYQCQDCVAKRKGYCFYCKEKIMRKVCDECGKTITDNKYFQCKECLETVYCNECCPMEGKFSFYYVCKDCK